ncbi:hypothetical protein L6452_21745 [Arctium lappa]|uniref:Uncharacterized protein n=1 Tax=Arctium lappa TaxID=4217 RepID=A0ACB9AXW7_ARCLA|nr:hypothetical protein L6452_21745 [Arctium lappa]
MLFNLSIFLSRRNRFTPRCTVSPDWTSSFAEEDIGRHGVTMQYLPGNATASKGLEVAVTNLQEYCNASAIGGGGKIIENEVDVVKNTNSIDHWDFLVVLTFNRSHGTYS